MNVDHPVRFTSAQLMGLFLLAVRARPHERVPLTLLSGSVMLLMSTVVCALGSAWPSRALSADAGARENLPVIVAAGAWAVLCGLMALVALAVQRDLLLISQRVRVWVYAGEISLSGRTLDLVRAESAIAHISAFLSLLLLQALVAAAALLMVFFG